MQILDDLHSEAFRCIAILWLLVRAVCTEPHGHHDEYDNLGCERLRRGDGTFLTDIEEYTSAARLHRNLRCYLVYDAECAQVVFIRDFEGIV